MKTEKELSDEREKYGKFLVTCSHCSHQFLPWRAFGITGPETEWKSGFICPNCNKLHIQKEN